jgi:hypothetical protein
VSPSKTSLRLPIGETFSREATATRGAWNAALTGGFNHRFLIIILRSRPCRAVKDVSKNCGDF